MIPSLKEIAKIGAISLVVFIVAKKTPLAKWL